MPIIDQTIPSPTHGFHMVEIPTSLCLVLANTEQCNTDKNNLPQKSDNKHFHPHPQKIGGNSQALMFLSNPGDFKRINAQLLVQIVFDCCNCYAQFLISCICYAQFLPHDNVIRYKHFWSQRHVEVSTRSLRCCGVYVTLTSQHVF